MNELSVMNFEVETLERNSEGFVSKDRPFPSDKLHLSNIYLDLIEGESNYPLR